MTDHRWQGPSLSSSLANSSLSASSLSASSRLPSSESIDAWCIVVAGGSGSRYGSLKQAVPLAGRSVLEWSIVSALRACGGVVVVVPSDGSLDEACSMFDSVLVVRGGASRSESVRNGLAAVPNDVAIVVVHDAARPLAPTELFARCVAAIRDGADGAIAAIAVTDTVKRVADGVVVDTVDRSSLVSVQTPQAFRADMLRRAHANQGDATDDAALIEALGGCVVVVDGDIRARKLTTPDDLVILEAFLAADATTTNDTNARETP